MKGAYRSMSRTLAVALVSASLLSACASPPASPGTRSPQVQPAEKDWAFQVQPYALFANIEGDAGVGRVASAPVDVDFGDILETLELGGMLHAETRHKSGWGVILDYGFMELGADKAGPAGIVLDAEVRQGVLEAFLSHRFQLAGDATLDAFGGIRWWDIDLDLSLSPGPVRSSRDVDWVDPVVGAKLAVPLGGDWSFLGRGDIGGFGIESDFSWTAAAGIQYRFSRLFALELHYRALSVDFDEGRGSPSFFSYDTITHGPLIGLSFDF